MQFKFESRPRLQTTSNGPGTGLSLPSLQTQAANPVSVLDGGGERDEQVAVAYGHPRLREFIFGGATRSFLNAEARSLFLSH